MRDPAVLEPRSRGFGGRRLGMVGRSPVMHRLRDLIERIAPLDTPVLIEGETGTGKDLVADALYRQSRRSEGPFVALNVATLPEELFESELFGHRKGAFSGAAEHPGLARAADGGTLFLDEIGELSMTNQAKLLRFLDTLEVRRVGGVRGRKVDARILFATNRDLRAAAEQGSMRRDLFYRLKVISIRVPSLRERREDLPLLVDHFTAQLARTFRRRTPTVSAAAMDRILAYDWPGNVRELKHELAQAMMVGAEGDEIVAAALSPHLRSAQRESRGTEPSGGRSLEELRREAEREIVERAVERSGWNVSAAARVLGINRVTLTRKLKRLGIRRPGPWGSTRT